MNAKVIAALFVAILMVGAEEQGRQMNWNGVNFLTKPGYAGNSGADLDTSSSMMSPQAKFASNYQSHSSQSLDGHNDIGRDSSYAGGDYGYEASPDSSYSSAATAYNSGGNGYDYQRFLPTTSKPFYSSPLQSQAGAPIPNSYLRGMPRDQLDHPVSSLSGMQSGRIPPYFPASWYTNRTVSAVGSGQNQDQQMTNRAGYDEDIPLGGVASSTSSGSLLSGTTIRNSLSRQDDFSYGTVNGGFGYASIPPAGAGYGYGGAYASGGVGLGGLYGGGVAAGAGYGYGGYSSPGYSSNYGVPYAGSNSYRPSYSYAGYNNGYGNYGPGYSSYVRSPLYAGGYSGAYGAGGGYSNAYGAGGGYSGAYGASGGYSGAGYGGEYGYGGGFAPAYYGGFKKAKKFFDWFKIPSYYDYGGYAAAPYDYYYNPPTVWGLTKFAFKGMMKAIFKPFFKWLPFCSPFYYYDREDRADDKLGSFVSAVTTFLPIGLFLAAIVPNIITVSSGRRKRSEAEEAQAAQEEATFPILDMISSFGVRALSEPSCQTKIVCEIGRMGGLPEANTVQRALWLTANYVPERLSRMVGLDKLFRQIRSQQCSDFMCASE